MGSTVQGHACPSMPNCHTLPMLVCYKNGYKIYSQRHRKQSRAGGGGAASRKRAPYFTLANKQKSLILKKSLSLLNL